MEFHHVSVLRDEVIGSLEIKPDGVYVDCTLGGAGHAQCIARQLNDKGVLIGFDQDAEALLTAKERLNKFDCTVELINQNFSTLKKELESRNYTEIDGFLFDLGVSSYQLDNAARGFSYMQDGPLDMRMNHKNELTAEIIVNEYDSSELEQILINFGEERWSKRIVQFIVAARQERRLTRTLELVDIIKKAIPSKAREGGPHPAKRTFQALRIAVNQELVILEQAFKDAVNLLKLGGKICVITFHSLEDRITKETFRGMSQDCKCPPEFPLCVCGGNHAKLKVPRKAINPTKEEVAKNPRARSARLRVGERV